MKSIGNYDCVVKIGCANCGFETKNLDSVGTMDVAIFHINSYVYDCIFYTNSSFVAVLHGHGWVASYSQPKLSDEPTNHHVTHPSISQ